jgi:hypothetical protein
MTPAIEVSLQPDVVQPLPNALSMISVVAEEGDAATNATTIPLARAAAQPRAALPRRPGDAVIPESRMPEPHPMVSDM